MIFPAAILTILGATLALLPSHARFQQESINEIVARTKAAYATTPTVRVRFEQNGAGGKVSGTLDYTTRDRFRLELPKQTIISNGIKTWTYTPARNQVVISRNDPSSNRLTPGQILTAFPGNYSTSLNGSRSINGRGCWVVDCVPGRGERIGDISLATLYIDKATHRFQQVDVQSPTLGAISLRIVRADYSPKLADSHFTFTAPQGVRVIDLSR